MNYKIQPIYRVLENKDFNLVINNENILPEINHSLHKFLQNTKNQISDKIELWDVMKKYTNPYEYIHTNYDNNQSVSKYKPISRAYFKMVEILNTFSLLDNYQYSKIKTFHLAEGPGGFIEALVSIRQNSEDNYIGMTLQDNTNHSVPGWKKSKDFLSTYKNIYLENGIDNTGNLYNYHNFKFVYEKNKHSIDLITADGGFDFSVDYCNQELMATRLILTEVLYALVLQKYNGHFVLKVFDLFTEISIDIVYLLSCFYNNVYIYKPNTSRYANSEKYIVCMNYKYNNCDSVFYKLYSIMIELNDKIGNENNNDFNIKRILNIDINNYFISCLTQINSIYGQQQIENINNTIILIENGNKRREKQEQYRKTNLSKCIKWCISNKMPYNNFQRNIFIDKKNKYTSSSFDYSSNNSDSNSDNNSIISY